MTQSGFVTVIGLPNAGKSSLVNALVKESVSIVTSKPQTTRKRTLGILAEDDKYQIIFVDTPGFIEAEAGLNKFLKSEISQALRDVHVIVAAIAPWEFNKDEKPWAVKVTENSKLPVIYIATQTDRKQDMVKWSRWSDKELLLTSCHTKAGLEELKKRILKYLPEGPFYYDADLYTNQTMREMSSEIIRKNCFESLHEEIPYGLAVQIRDFKEEKTYKIHADIILARENHKSMVIGQGGQMLKRIGTQSRLEIEKSFGENVFLKLHVVVKPQWTKNPNWMEELGYAERK